MNLFPDPPPDPNDASSGNAPPPEKPPRAARKPKKVDTTPQLYDSFEPPTLPPVIRSPAEPPPAGSADLPFDTARRDSLPIDQPLFGVSAGRCRLDPTSFEGLELLTSGWTHLTKQLIDAVRASGAAGTQFSAVATPLIERSAEFQLPWPTLGQAFRDWPTAHDPAHRTEVALNLGALHEISILALLLGSYGKSAFLHWALDQVVRVASDGSVPKYISHTIALPQVRGAIEKIAHGSDLEGIFHRLLTTSPSRESVRGGEAERMAALLSFNELPVAFSAKDSFVIEMMRESLPRPGARIIVGTLAREVELLRARLTKAAATEGLLTTEAVTVTRAGDGELPAVQKAALVVADLARLPEIRGGYDDTILIYSPLIFDDKRISILVAEHLARVHAIFPKDRIEILRTDPSHSRADTELYVSLLTEFAARLPPEGASSRAQPFNPIVTHAAPDLIDLGKHTLPGDRRTPPSGADEEIVGVPENTKQRRRGSYQQTFTAVPNFMGLPDPTDEEIAVKEAPVVNQLPTIDPASLPKDAAMLNARLGIDMVRADFSCRIDQLDPFFTMIETQSFRYLLWAPTGYGKTPVALLVAATILGRSPLTPAECRGKTKVLYVTPFVDLGKQVEREALKFLNLEKTNIGVVNGRVSEAKRQRIIADDTIKLLMSSPVVLSNLFPDPKPDQHDPLAEFAVAVFDECQVLEGDHPSVEALKRLKRAGVPILFMSGTPFRDQDDRTVKELLGDFGGPLKPKTLPALKKHEALVSSVPDGDLHLGRELTRMSYAPYIALREDLANAPHLLQQVLGNEEIGFGRTRKTLKRQASIVPFNGVNFKRIKFYRHQRKEIADELAAKIPDPKDLEAAKKKVHGALKGALGRISGNASRIMSMSSRASLLLDGGPYAFLQNFGVFWMMRRLERKALGRGVKLFEDYLVSADYRGIVRTVARGTPYIHLLNCATLSEALEAAFNLKPDQIPNDARTRIGLFENLALYQMVKRPGYDNPKERSLITRLEELHEQKRLQGVLVFVEPRALARYYALRLEARFGPLGCHSAYVTGGGDGFASRRLAFLEQLSNDPAATYPGGNFGIYEPEIRECFTGERGEKLHIIAATSKLSTGINIPVAQEAHLLTINGDAIELLQMIGRVGRPLEDDFHGQVGNCFYHWNRNTSELYKVLATLNKYTWLKEVGLEQATKLPPPFALG